MGMLMDNHTLAIFPPPARNVWLPGERALSTSWLREECVALLVELEGCRMAMKGAETLLFCYLIQNNGDARKVFRIWTWHGCMSGILGDWQF
jgi:hypothetical protein